MLVVLVDEEWRGDIVFCCPGCIVDVRRTGGRTDFSWASFSIVVFLPDFMCTSGGISCV